ncbi:MAG: DUF3857 domain-containing protein, partial [bacterium]
LDAEGRKYGRVFLYYDKFSLVNVDGRLFDAEGNKIRSLSKSDINDYAASSSYSLYDDNRVCVATLYHSIYPYTVETEYEYAYNGYISWPSWYPEERDASVEYSEYEVRLHLEDQLRYFTTRMDEPVQSEDGGVKVYRWVVTGLKPFEPEPVGPGITDQYRNVRLAPGRFEIDGHAGDLSSWENFGSWFAGLSTGRDKLPAKIQEEIVGLTAGMTDPKEKIRTLYSRLQETTRYVSVQLGIGGWQPFDATYVCERGYGDCKALSNYMIAMLKAVNVNAYPALIYSGTPQRRVIPQFPYNQFNHMIVFVPLAHDTVWLECTDQTIPMGHLSTSTENRFALICGPHMGVLVSTPTSKAEENTQVRNAMVTVSPNGYCTVELRMTCEGNQQDNVRYGLKDATPKERDEWMKRYLEVPAYTLEGADYSRVDSSTVQIGFDLTLKVPRYATQAGNRLLFQPNLLERNTYVPKALEKRIHPIVNVYPYLNIDTVVYMFPSGYSVDALPKPVIIGTSFARYESAVVLVTPEILRYVRRMELRQPELSPDRYNEYRKFFQDVAQADKAMASMVRK